MAAYLRLKSSFYRLKPLFRLQRFKHTLGEADLEAEFVSELGPKTMPVSDAAHVDTSEWKKVESRKVGLSLSMIPEASKIVVRVLQNAGYDAYLVGGCIRDLILKKAPKDFDVITTATLHEIKRKFHRAYIVGRRFPICQVHVSGFIIEVSSFATVASDATNNQNSLMSKMPKGYDQRDITRWMDSLKRDFTVNSLFYDPFAGKIYDYSTGMTDLTSLKLRTLVPANLSFKTDCARIMRGLRIASRLGLSITEDVERALHDLYPSVTTLDKARLMLEMNYMLSYGAARASLLLLKRFKLLEVLLPFQASYLAGRSGAHSPLMLMELFSNLDSVVSCEQPCHSRLWISLLAFHIALTRHPQNPLVVWTFSSVMFHTNWKEGVKAARELAVRRVNFVPEILESSNDATLTDDKLAERVTKFALIVQDSMGNLTDPESLIEAVDHNQSSPSSLPVFISKKAGREVAHIFSVLVHDIESWKEERRSDSIDYKLLGKGDVSETRFVLGKVIMGTMRGGVSQSPPKLMTEKKQGFGKSKLIIANKQAEIEKSISMVSEPEVPKSKYSMQQGSGKFDDEVIQHIPKNQKQIKKILSDSEKKLVKDEILEITSTWNDEVKNNDQQKKVLKEVENLRSLQKRKVNKEKEMWRLLEKDQKVPKMAREQKVEPGKPKSKDRVKQGSGGTDGQVTKQISKKKKNSKAMEENTGEILSTRDNKGQKKAVKKVEKLLPLPKILSLKGDKIDWGKHIEAQASQDISELETSKSKRKVKPESCDPDNENAHKPRPKKPKNKIMTSVLELNNGKDEVVEIPRAGDIAQKKQEQQRPKKRKRDKNTTSVLEKEKVGEILETEDIVQTWDTPQKNQEQREDVKSLANWGKDGKAEDSIDILRVLAKTTKVTKQPESKGLLNGVTHSNLFNREKEEPTGKDAKETKDSKVRELTPKTIRKLSSLFK